jgi:hypothetical protein
MCSLTVKSISTPVPKIPNHQNDDRHYRDNDDNLFHRHSQNIRLTGFSVSAFEVESVTRKREVDATGTRSVKADIPWRLLQQAFLARRDRPGALFLLRVPWPIQHPAPERTANCTAFFPKLLLFRH